MAQLITLTRFAGFSVLIVYVLACAAPASGAIQSETPAHAAGHSGELISSFRESGLLEGYQVPPAVFAEVINAEPLPHVTISPDQRWLILTHRKGALGIDQLMAPRIALARRQIDPRTNGRHADSTATGTAMTLVRISNGQQWKLGVPESGLSVPLWSPDSQQFLFRRTVKDAVELWVGGISRKELRQLTGIRLLALQGVGAPCAWLPDSRRAICHEVPHGRGAPPEEPLHAVGPVIQESGQREARGFIYSGQLKDPHDEALYEYYMTSQPVLIDTASGEKRPIGTPGIYDFLNPSPDGNYLLSIRTVRPYSNLYADDSRFPKKIEILDSQGRSLRTLAERPLGHGGSPLGGWAPPGLRRFSWLPDAAATLVYFEPLDGGDPRVEAQYRDRLLRLDVPFRGQAVELIRTRGRMTVGPELMRFSVSQRFANLAWLRDGVAWLEEVDFSNQRKRTWQVPVADPKRSPELLFEFSTEGGYEHSGGPLLRKGADGGASGYEEAILHQDEQWIYLVGQGASVEGNRPFLDRFNLRTRERERVFRSSGECHEQVIAVLDQRKILTRYETPFDPPNYFIKDMKRGERTAVTNIPHPAPELRHARPQLLHYVRDDGIPLSGQLYLPLGYKPNQQVPVVIWAYPWNYKDAEIAGVVRGSPNSFMWNSRPTFQLAARLLVTQGYAVLWNASMPVVGGANANDTAVAQLVANGRAAVEKLVTIGVADESRIAIAGHSYGGLMVATLLAHSDLFAAGIAIAGGYNLTNTPVGFQQETRTLWQAPHAYTELSAVFHSDRISAPLLLMHGERDDTYGTLPIESQRMYQALNGLGSKARLVMLPYEGHVPIAKESIGHISWEILNWLDRYLKHAEEIFPDRQTSEKAAH